jgi:hypothetical protein
MILTAYMDESGTHKGSPRVAVGSALANAGQWAKFQNGLDKIKREFGFSVLHTTELKARKGEFKGWPVEKCLSLINTMTALAANTLMYSADFVIEEGAYDEFRRDLPNKIRVDSRYGLGFRICLAAHVEEILRRIGNHKKFEETRLHIVMESGCPNAMDADRIYLEIKKKLKLASPLLASLTFAAKTDADPLMFADLLAHTAYMRGIEEPVVAKSAPSRGAGRPKARIVHFSYDANGIRALKQKLVDELEARRAWGARRSLPEGAQPA